MGVMSCSRASCENIMCDTYVEKIGYICWECKEEFKTFFDADSYVNLTEGKILTELEKFMKHPKTSSETTTINEFFDKRTQ